MSSIDQILRKRKSHRPADFLQEEISQQELEAVLSVAPYAPNHKKTKPWRYIVFRGESKDQLAQKLAELYKENTATEAFLEKKFESIKENVNKSPVVICIIHQISQSVPEWEEHAAIAMSVLNMWLKITDMGLGGYWSTPGMIRHLDEFLELDFSQNCIGLFYLGKINPNEEIREYDWKEFVSFRD
ncbi:MAG: nitroreductase [Flavobacteriaceae bacterium]|nr:nitroreductase [Flavobacteriaceae bacterium]